MDSWKKEITFCPIGLTVYRAIVEEIVSLGRMRIQKIFGLFDHVLVLELFHKHHRRLFFVFDYKLETKTFHVQKEKPVGEKSQTPCIALLKKYALSQTIRFNKLDEEGTSIKARFSHGEEDFSLIFDIDSSYKAGLFRGEKILASIPYQNTPPYRSGFLVNEVVATNIDANLQRAAAYYDQLMKFHRESLVLKQTALLKRELAKKKKLFYNVTEDLARCKQSLLLEHDANLLKANMHILRRGMKEALLMDYEHDPPSKRAFRLNEKLSPQEQVTKLFARIKKAKRGQQIIEHRLQEISNDIDALKTNIENVNNTPLITTTAHELKKSSAKKAEETRRSFRQFISHDGIKLWVGKSAKDSDDMLRQAKGLEWFFHARDVAGAHVIAKSSENLSEKTIYEAALLAHHWSKNRSSQSGIIQYTRVKYVQKKKGLAPGKVLITQEKTLEIDVDPNMLRQLLARQ